MNKDRYTPADMSIWKGRIDSTENYDAFRWHQWVHRLDLDCCDIPAFKGKLGFGLLGFCSDEGVRRNHGRIGAANGPDAIRKELANLPCTFSQEVMLFDAGNVSCRDGNLEQSQAALATKVAELRRLGLFPLVLGGGHEVALGHYRGHRDFIAENKEKPNIGIINFDAHLDIRPYCEGGSSGTMFKQIADECAALSLDFRYLCIGVQTYSNTPQLFKTTTQLGASHILAKDLTSQGDWYMIEKLDEFIKSAPHLYITVCADVFSSAFAPGVSATQPLGLNPETVLKCIKHLIHSERVIGFDIAEVSPRFDQDSTTASLAKVLIYSVVNTLCSLQGLTRN